MTIRGTIRKGKVELEAGANLPDGTKVAVRPLTAAQPSVYRLYDLALDATEDDGLPADYAAESDHYLYGAPRRTPAPKPAKKGSKPARKRSAATPRPRSTSPRKRNP